MSTAWAGLGVLSLLAAAGIYFVAQKMRRGAPILTAWAVVPGFCSGRPWIMANSLPELGGVSLCWVST
ncbi:MAG: hypothetical protein ACLT9P_06975 [Evtepia gabavorous]